MPKNEQVSNYRGLVPSIQPETDFYHTNGFREVVDNVELITYMKFQNISMTGCKDMDKNVKNPSCF